MLRDIAEGIAEYIANDAYLRDGGNVSIVVEDKADFNFEISQALGQLGVCVTISMPEFRRVDRSPILQGPLKIEISCLENPSLNRGKGVLTGQAVMEHLAKILHYRKFPFLANQLLFDSFRREDVDEANILRGDFEVNTLLGFEDKWAAEKREGKIN